MSEDTLSLLKVIAFASIPIGTIIAISYAMTAKDQKVRFWGCRIAASLFAAFGLGIVYAVIVMPHKSYAAGQDYKMGVGMALAAFCVAGWQWRMSTR